MARGYPDDTPNVGRNQEGVFLPQRILAPVWLHDDFESPVLKWRFPAGTAALDSTAATAAAFSQVYTGSSCLKLTSAAGNIGRAQRYISGVRLDARLGFATHWSYGTTADFANTEEAAFLLKLQLTTKAYIYKFGVSYNPRDGKWHYSDDGGSTWTELYTYLMIQPGLHYVKLIVDPTTLYCVSLQIDDYIHDMSAFAFGAGANVGATSSSLLTIDNKGDTGDNAILYIDDYIVTYGET